MAGIKVSALTSVATLAGGALLYAVIDTSPTGSRHILWSDVVAQAYADLGISGIVADLGTRVEGRGSGIASAVAFWASTDSITADANLTWDASALRVVGSLRASPDPAKIDNSFVAGPGHFGSVPGTQAVAVGASITFAPVGSDLSRTVAVGADLLVHGSVGGANAVFGRATGTASGSNGMLILASDRTGILGNNGICIVRGGASTINLQNGILLGSATGVVGSYGATYVTAIGFGVTASASGVVVVGRSASATSDYAVAVGQEATGTGIAIGYRAGRPGGVTRVGGGVLVGSNADPGSAAFVVGIGNNVVSNGTQSVAVGDSAVSSSDLSIAVGCFAEAVGAQSICVGGASEATAGGSIVVGASSYATGNNAVALGYQANATGSNSIAIGDNIGADGQDSIAIGSDAHVFVAGDGAVSIGADSGVDGAFGVAIGDTAGAGEESVAIGGLASGNANRCVVIGSEAYSQSANMIAIGYRAGRPGGVAKTGAGVLIGNNANCESATNVVGIGGSVIASGSGSIAVGQGAASRSNDTIAIGRGASVSSGVGRGIGIGGHVSVPVEDSIVIGWSSVADHLDCLVLGTDSWTTATNQIVIGGAGDGYTQMIVGSGPTSATPAAFTFQTTDATGTNIAGADLIIYAGRGTGSAAGGAVEHRAYAAGTSGSAINTAFASSRLISTSFTITIAGTALVTVQQNSITFAPTVAANGGADVYRSISNDLGAAVRTFGQLTGGASTTAECASILNQPSVQNITGDKTAIVALSANRTNLRSNSALVTSRIVTGVAGWYEKGDLGQALGAGGALALTNYYGGYIANLPPLASGVSITNHYGIVIEEPTRGSTRNQAIRVIGGESWFGGDIVCGTAGKGVKVAEGSDATMGLVATSGGSATVSTTKVTANSRIFLCVQANGGTATAAEVTSRIPGTSFSITVTGSSTVDVAWLIIEPA